MPITKHVVDVWGKPHEIKLYQKSKSVWVAVGNYIGERLEVQDRSETSAAKAWQDAARYKGNDGAPPR